MPMQALENAPAARSNVRTEFLHILVAEFSNLHQVHRSACRILRRLLTPTLAVFWCLLRRISRDHSRKPEAHAQEQRTHIHHVDVNV